MLTFHLTEPGRAAAGRGRWHEIRVKFENRDFAERPMATVIAPCLSRLEAEGALARWWFMRRPPVWRIRVQDADIAAVSAALDEAGPAGLVTERELTAYEPGTAAFGGADGMDAAHDMFCADTRGVMDYLRREPPPVGRPELSLLLVSAMLNAAGLDWSGRGDVFAWVAAMRTLPCGQAEDTTKLAGHLRTLLTTPTQDTSPLFTPGGTLEFAMPWHGAFETAGRRLAADTLSGRLGRGLRVILAHAVVFHWNRLGLPVATQSLLARAAVDAYLPVDGP